MSIDRNELLSKFHQLPSLPLILHEVIASFNNPKLDTVSLARNIEHDLGISAKVLRMANSSFYGLPRKVGSIQDAVTVLGFDTVRSLVLSTGIVRLFPPPSIHTFDRQTYWQRCFRIATISKALSKHLQQGGGLAFTAGMFCEIGQIVLDVCIPRQFSELLVKQLDSKLSLTELERAEFGFDHFDIGADLLHQWNFPLEIEQLVRNLNNQNAQAKFDPMLCVVNIALLVEQNVTGEELITKLSKINCSEMKLTWEEIKDNLPASEDLENLYLNVK